MIIDNIRTGDRVEITYPLNDKENTVLLSKVETKLDLKRVMVHAPVVAGKAVKLPMEKTYSVLFCSEAGMYRFNADVIDYKRVDGFSLCTLRLLSPGERVQNREFFRFNCAIPVTFTILTLGDDLTDETPVQSTNPESYEGVVRDISGGGMRMMAKINMHERTLIRTMLMLGGDYIMIFGQVVRRQYNPNAVFPYVYHLKFSSMSYSEQERIVTFIYNEQRKSLQRNK